jgi:hypothetical protein
MDASPIRASDAERETAMARLRDGAGEGRLTFEELADRLQDAGDARTRADLERLTADLPPAGELATVEPAAPPAAVAPPSSSSVFGDHRRDGVWRVPARGRWSTIFGDVVLDLREAHVYDSVVEIEANTIFGDVQLLVPESVAVDVHSRTTFGDVRQDAGGAAPPGAPRIVLTGYTVFGDVKVQSKRLRERLADRWRARAG